MDSSTISLKASNGLFVGFFTYTEEVITAKKPSADPMCKFTVQVVAPGKITLRTDNGLYLSRVSGMGGENGDAIQAVEKSVDESCVFSYQYAPASPSLVLKADNGLYIYPSTFPGYEEILVPAKKEIDPSCYFQLIGSIPDSNGDGKGNGGERNGIFNLPPNTAFGVTVLVNSAAVQTVSVFVDDASKPSATFTGSGTSDRNLQTQILNSGKGRVHVIVEANGKQSKLGSRQVDIFQKAYFGLVASEDGTDNDYNDGLVILNWPLG
ncbi:MULTISPECIES: fucose-binding lectin II [Paraburkholderia]|uniref:fucose-binding lectin II n=1 Tax=Paraburkholderia TaxID=1822464 RepID=UPI00036AD237|nr:MULTISPECIES: fucose-binding lectin II [Paraburkholderia]MDH6146405.1 hypothetical protein [Paraburkholderia sp. WSM4179]